MCRAAGLQLADLSNSIVIALREDALTPDQGTQLVRGAGFLDDLRVFPDIARLLPAEPIGPIKSRRRQFQIPGHLDAPLAAWIETATTVYPEGWTTAAVREKLAEVQKPGSRGIFQAALRNYIDTLGRLRPITPTDDLPRLFTESDIYAVVNAWDLASGEPGSLCARSMYTYMSRIARALDRNGCEAQAVTVAMAIETIPVLREGRGASERMSAKTETWCRELVESDDKRRIFETQHWEYERRAREALAEAEAAGFDLVGLARHPESLKRLETSRRRLAKDLLGQARMFGACAAFAAIELEGAPLRKENTLGLLMAGPKATFFDHSRDKADPHFRVVLPNELLKNGKFLTLRNQQLPPIHIKDRQVGDAGVRILRFYLDCIRPLFAGHDMSNALFPSLGGTGHHLGAGTFGDWLLDCSIAIEFQLTSHNFRHGICSLQINDDPNCIEELAILLGDSPRTARKYYAFLHRGNVLDAMQDQIVESRAQHRGSHASLREAA